MRAPADAPGGFFGGDGYAAVGVAVADDITGPWRKERTEPLSTGATSSGVRGTTA